MRRGTKAGEGRVSARRGDVGVPSAAPGLTGHAGGTALGERKQSGRYRLTVRHHRTEAKPGPPAPCPAARESHPSFAPERTLFFVVENVRDVACGAKGPGAASARFLAPRGEQTVRGAGKAVLLSAATGLRRSPVLLPPARQPGRAILRLPQNGHFSSSWKMSEMSRAVQRDRAQRVHVFLPRAESKRSGARERPCRCPPPPG